MAPLDPQHLLKALNELLGPSGEILGPAEATRIASLMKDANKLVSKCIYINILKVKTPKETLEKLLNAGAWDTINDWLQETKEEDNYPFLVEILKVYQLLPVTVDILKTNNAAKTIKQLCKSDNESVKTLAGNIFEAWMAKVKGNSNNSDDKHKKKKKDKSKDKEKGDTNSKSHHSSGDSKSKSKDSKHSSSQGDRDKKSSESKKRNHEEDVEEENMDTSSNDSAQSDDKVSVRQGSGLKLHIKLGGDKDRTGGKSEETEKKRASTVKRPPSKFRSTGLEEEPAKLPKNADLSKPIPKRTGSDIKSDLPHKRSRPNMPPPLTVPAPGSIPTGGPSSTSPQSPGELHGKVKIAPTRPKSNHVMHESSGFMDSLETSTRTFVPVKKKRRSSGSIQGSTPPSKGSSTPTTPPSPVSPTTAVAKSLPSVPSFYKDTQESESSPDKEVKTERSPSPTEGDKVKTEEEAKTEVKTEPAEVNGDDARSERSQSPSDSNSSTSFKGLLTTGATMVKKKKKSVSWKEDHEIKEVFYFEMDEDERVNVNRPKDFHQAQKMEMMSDRRAFESSVRMKNDHMVEQLTWYRPKVCIGYRSDIDYGKESKEKAVQKARESGVLQALFFNKTMLPDNPQEPDMESEEPQESKIIPLDDVSGGEQFLYNYESHPQAVTNKPTGAPLIPDTSMGQMPPFPGGPMVSQAPPTSMPQQGPFNVPPGLQLPPDLAQMLNQIQNAPSNPNDPVMTQVQKILNNLICGGEQNYEELHQIQQMMGLHMGMQDGMMQGPPPGMGPGMMGMPPGGMPMAPRGLLGNAPPGFLQRPMGPGPGPNRFGPPGQGNWGPQGNMNMGPQMGPQGGNFGGRMRGPGPNQGRGGGGNRGGGKRGGRDGGGSGNFRVLCRHFASGKCRMGSNCTFLHPGVNGPPLDNMNMDQTANT